MMPVEIAAFTVLYADRATVARRPDNINNY